MRIGNLQPLIPMRKSLGVLNYRNEVRMVDFSAVISNIKPKPRWKVWVTRMVNLVLIFS